VNVLVMYSQLVKINGSLQMEKLCIECSGVCGGGTYLCWCVWTHASGELSLCVSVRLSVQLSVRPTMLQQASIKYRVKFKAYRKMF